jgi:hypothetical protein
MAGRVEHGDRQFGPSGQAETLPISQRGELEGKGVSRVEVERRPFQFGQSTRPDRWSAWR